MVKPLAFLEVELSSVARAMLKREEANEFIHRHYFLVVARIPAEQGKEVNHSLGQIAFLSVTLRDNSAGWVVPFEWEHWESELVAIALAQFAVAHGLEQQRQMYEFRHCVGPTESLVKQHVEWCRREPFFATDNVGYKHQVVVNNVGQVICRKVVGRLIQHLVIENRRVNGHLATKQVVDHNVVVRLDFEAHHILFAGIDKCLHLVGAHCERVAH